MVELVAADVVCIREYFKDLEDPRCHVNRKHLLGDLIVICICAVIGGADGPKAIGKWAQAKADWLETYLALPGGIPSHDTIGRLLAALKPAAFQICFQAWLQQISRPLAEAESGQEIIAIDGKTIRRSHDRRNQLGPLHLVSAWSVQRGLSLGQLATAEKSNEITAIPELLEQIQIEGAIVTVDAMGCQKDIVQKIVDGGGDYVLALKGNHEKLHLAVEQLVHEAAENDFAGARHFQERLQGHGRIDTIDYYQFPAPATLPDQSSWTKLQTIGVAIRVSQQGDKTTSDTRYYISCLRLGVRQFARAVRQHWGIENTLHWCLDVTFREDDSRLRDRLAADNLAWLRRFAISLLKQQNDKESIAMRRRMAGWNDDYLAQVLGLKAI